MSELSTKPELMDDIADERMVHDALVWLLESIAADPERLGSEPVTRYEIFRRYHDGGHQKWPPAVVEVVRKCLLDISVHNLQPLDSDMK